MPNHPTEDFYGTEETARRRDDVIRRMANTPPKPHSEMKVGKPKKPGDGNVPKKKTKAGR